MRTTPRTPTSSSGASGWSPSWRHGSSTAGSSRWSAPPGAGSRRSCGRASCPLVRSGRLPGRRSLADGRDRARVPTRRRARCGRRARRARSPPARHRPVRGGLRGRRGRGGSRPPRRAVLGRRPRRPRRDRRCGPTSTRRWRRCAGSPPWSRTPRFSSARPTDEELQRIVEVPARRTGCEVDPALIARVVDDVAGHDAALPLVSAALAEVWERRDGDTLHARTGTSSSVGSRPPSSAWERGPSSAPARRPIRAVMLRLVDVTEDGQWVRRRVQVTDLPDPSSLRPSTRWWTNGSCSATARRSTSSTRSCSRRGRSSTAGSRRCGPSSSSTASSAAMPTAWDGAGPGRGLPLSGRPTRRRRRAPRHGESVDGLVGASSSPPARRRRTRRRGAGAPPGPSQPPPPRAPRRSAPCSSSSPSSPGCWPCGKPIVRTSRLRRPRPRRFSADARGLGDRAAVTSRTDAALLLAVAGVRLHDVPETRANLFAVLAARRLIAPQRSRLRGTVASEPEGARLVAYADGRLALHDADNLERLAQSAEVPAVRFWSHVEFSPDGEQLAVIHEGYDELSAEAPDTVADPVVLYDADTLRPVPAARQLGGVPRPPPVWTSPTAPTPLRRGVVRVSGAGGDQDPAASPSWSGTSEHQASPSPR